MPPRSFDFHKLLDVAEDLAQRSEGQYLRTAVGRAYYYVFHLARQRLEANSFTFKGGAGSHRQVWDKFNDSPDSQCKVLAEMGSSLKEKRVTADYQPNYPRIADDVTMVIHKAKTFAERLDKLKLDLPRNMGVKA